MIRVAVATTYIILGLLTYGHMASQIDQDQELACGEMPAMDADLTPYLDCLDAAYKESEQWGAVTHRHAVAAAAAWPIYWASQLASLAYESDYIKVMK